MEVKSPFTLQGGAEDCSRVTAGESGLVSQSGGKSRDVSRVSAGSLGFHSSCHGDLRDPLVLPQESQVSFRIVRGSVGLLSNHFHFSSNLVQKDSDLTIYSGITFLMKGPVPCKT